MKTHYKLFNKELINDQNNKNKQGNYSYQIHNLYMSLICATS